MRFFTSAAISALVSTYLLGAVPAASIHADGSAVDISLRSPSNIEKRFDNAQFTFYNVGLGACGKVNVATDFVVALNAPQYSKGAHCFQNITISYMGKSTKAQIVDECVTCPEYGLDLSRGLFDFFAEEWQGLIHGSWDFVN